MRLHLHSGSCETKIDVVLINSQHQLLESLSRKLAFIPARALVVRWLSRTGDCHLTVPRFSVASLDPPTHFPPQCPCFPAEPIEPHVLPAKPTSCRWRHFSFHGLKCSEIRSQGPPYRASFQVDPTGIEIAVDDLIARQLSCALAVLDLASIGAITGSGGLPRHRLPSSQPLQPRAAVCPAPPRPPRCSSRHRNLGSPHDRRAAILSIPWLHLHFQNRGRQDCLRR